jgi:hypothetical protein
VLNPPVQMLASEGINNLAVFIDRAFVAMEPSGDVKKRIDWHADCPWLARAIICKGPSGSSQSGARVSENFLGFFDHGKPRLSAVGPLFAQMVLVITDAVPPARWSAKVSKEVIVAAPSCSQMSRSTPHLAAFKVHPRCVIFPAAQRSSIGRRSGQRRGVRNAS